MRQMKDGEDTLAKAGWDDCACFLKYYAIHCVQVVVAHGGIWGSLIQACLAAEGFSRGAVAVFLDEPECYACFRPICG